MIDPSQMLGGGGAPPPDLSALGAGAPPAAPPDAGPPTPDTSGAVTSPQSGDNSDNLRHAIMFIQAYMEGETDDQDLAEGAKILHQAQSLLANQQKLQDSATGAGPGARIVRKATAQQNYGG